MTNVFFSGLLALMFLFMGVQVRGGNTDFLGKNMKDQIRPELKEEYCKEMSIPLFLFAVIEAVDAGLQSLDGFGAVSSLVLLGIGMVICFGWIYTIQSKYKKM